MSVSTNRAEGLHLLGNHRAGVEGFDPCSQALRRRDRLESGDTRADDEYPRRRDGASRCHHHGKDLRRVRSGEYYRHVTRQAGLGRQRVHLLRPRGSRDHFHGHGRHATSGEFFDERFLVEGIEKADVQGVLCQELQILLGGFSDTEHDLRRHQRRGDVLDHVRARRFVVPIRKPGRDSETRFDHDIEAEINEFFGALWDQRGAQFAGPRLPWHGDTHP